MKKLFLALALTCMTAACADAPTAPAAAREPNAPRLSTSGAFGVDLVVEQGPSDTSPR